MQEPGPKLRIKCPCAKLWRSNQSPNDNKIFSWEFHQFGSNKSNPLKQLPHYEDWSILIDLYTHLDLLQEETKETSTRPK